MKTYLVVEFTNFNINYGDLQVTKFKPVVP